MDTYTPTHRPAARQEARFGNGSDGNTTGNSRTTTVLIVDDEEIVRLVLTEMLERLGLEVLSAENGIEALDILRDPSVQVKAVVFDMTMPEMQGDELFYAIRQINPGIKMILSSGMLDAGSVDELNDQGLDGYLPKPYNFEQITALMERVLHDS